MPHPTRSLIPNKVSRHAFGIVNDRASFDRVHDWTWPHALANKLSPMSETLWTFISLIDWQDFIPPMDTCQSAIEQKF